MDRNIPGLRILYRGTFLVHSLSPFNNRVCWKDNSDDGPIVYRAYNRIKDAKHAYKPVDFAGLWDIGSGNAYKLLRMPLTYKKIYKSEISLMTLILIAFVLILRLQDNEAKNTVSLVVHNQEVLLLLQKSIQFTR